MRIFTATPLFGCLADPSHQVLPLSLLCLSFGRCRSIQRMLSGAATRDFFVNPCARMLWAFFGQRKKKTDSPLALCGLGFVCQTISSVG